MAQNGKDMHLGSHIIGVCSWSLQPENFTELVARVRAAGLSHVQIAIGSLLDLDDAGRASAIAQLKSAGIVLTAGMISFAGEDYTTIAVIKRTGGFVPTEMFPDRRARTIAAADLCRSMGVRQLSTHIGFVPPSNTSDYKTMCDRVSEIAGALDERKVELLMETGQESASELLQFLNDLRARNVGINFDPANMILYGAGDPVEAIGVLERHIRHVHIKDATASEQPGVIWGSEVPFGEGEVPVAEFLNALHRTGYMGPLVIEREAGSRRVQDVKFAVETLQRHL